MRTFILTALAPELLPDEDETTLTREERERMLETTHVSRTELDDPLHPQRQWAHGALAAAGLL